jgi:flagellar basal body rod protein FlgG
MINGLYSAASAMLATMHEQSVLAHNTANLDTPGFKQVLVGLDDFTNRPALVPSAQQSSVVNSLGRYVGHVGLGVETRPEGTDFSAGPMKFTGEPLDLAIHGNGFFHIQMPDGEEGYTRDGRFNLDAEGNLVTVDGNFVLDDGGEPIQIEETGEISVTGNGTIYVDGEDVAQVGVAVFENPEEDLKRTYPNTFTSDAEPTDEGVGEVVQKYLETPNISPAEIMTKMTQVARHYEAAQKMVQNQDELLGQAISTLGQF